MASNGFFIAGTDTDVGKTHVAAGLIHALAQAGLRVSGYKPVAAGCQDRGQGLQNEDALALMSAASVELPYDKVNPYALAPAIAPHIAAKEAGVHLDLQHLLRVFDDHRQHSDCVIVEGAGGWLVPLDDQISLADLAEHLQLPVILVVGLRLGCISHALLTQEAILSRGLTLAGWVANTLDPSMPRLEDNLDTLCNGLNTPLLGRIPYDPEARAADVGARIDIQPLI